jgi:hypothetical protein
MGRSPRHGPGFPGNQWQSASRPAPFPGAARHRQPRKDSLLEGTSLLYILIIILVILAIVYLVQRIR